MQITAINYYNTRQNNSYTNFMAYNRTLAMLKPGFEHCEKDVVQMFKAEGLEVEKRLSRILPREMAKKHYIEKAEKPYYQELTDYITSGPVVEMLVAGEEAINKVRQLTGPIRQMFGYGDSMKNVMHSSANDADAARELALHFNIKA